VTVIRVNVPPDQTPEEEAELVARVAASYEESTGSSDVTVEVNRTEEVDFRHLGQQGYGG
jgi:phenylpyruvate tautomerase PptA (4-oxalocrotonate tautomerase family)